MPSELIGRIKLGLGDRLRNPARRRRMFVRMAQDEIAMQIRALRERRGYQTQSAFARYAKMQQSAVSRIENADYKGWTFKTLLKVADALDARLRVSFEPAEDVIRRFDAAEAPAAMFGDATDSQHGAIAMTPDDTADFEMAPHQYAWTTALMHGSQSNARVLTTSEVVR